MENQLEERIKAFLDVSAGSGFGAGSGAGSGNGSGNGSDFYTGFGDDFGFGFGFGDGAGVGAGNSYGYGYDGAGDCAGDGSGDGSGIPEFNGRKVYQIDGVATLIDSVSGNFAKGKILNSDFTLTPCYISKVEGCFAHGETLAKAEKTAEKKITSAAKKAFDREEYMTRTGVLEPYEETVLMAIVFYRLRANDGNELIPGSYCSPTYEQMQDFLKTHANDNRWKRKAIVEYIESSMSKPSMFSDLVRHLSIEVEDFANRTRQEAQTRIQSINDELREMGYDEKGNKL